MSMMTIITIFPSQALINCAAFSISEDIIKRSVRNVAEGQFRRLSSQRPVGMGLKARFFGNLGRKSPIQGDRGRPNAKQRELSLDVAVEHLVGFA
jgi:hypothetical protein